MNLKVPNLEEEKSVRMSLQKLAKKQSKLGKWQQRWKEVDGPERAFKRRIDRN